MKDNIYAVIDTNVLVSALITSKTDVATFMVVKKLFENQFIPVISESIILEYKMVLRRPKFGFSKDLIDIFISVFIKNGDWRSPMLSKIKMIDEKDRPFWDAAHGTDALTYIVTGNIKHYPKEYYVVTPNQFLNILEVSSSNSK